MRNPLQRAYLKSSEPFREVIDHRFASVDERLVSLQAALDDAIRASADTQDFVRSFAVQVGAELQRLADTWTVPDQVVRAAEQEAEALGLAGLRPPLADLVNFAASHRGFRAEAGLWVNDPVVVEHGECSVRLAQVNSRIVEVPFCTQAVCALPRGSRVVDVGASESTLALALASLGYRVTALDPRGYPFPQENLIVHEGTLDDYAPTSPVDAVVFLSSIEHFGLPAYALDDLVLPDGDRRALDRARQVLRPGGLLVLTVPYGDARTTEFERTYDAGTLAGLLDGWEDVRVEIAVRRSEIEWGLQPDGIVGSGHEGVALLTARTPA